MKYISRNYTSIFMRFCALAFYISLSSVVAAQNSPSAPAEKTGTSVFRMPLAGEKLIGEMVTAASGTEACLEISVEGFTGVSSLEFGIPPNPTVATFTRTINYNLPGLSDANISNTAFGTEFVWSSPDQANGNTVPDGTVIMEICYDVTGTDGQTVEVAFNSVLTPSFFGRPDGTQTQPTRESGSITISTPLGIADNTVNPDNCFAMNNGGVEITPEGGSAPYTYMWSNTTTNKDLTDVSGGTYMVTISDAGSSQIIETYVVPFDTITPIADIGEVDAITCAELEITLGGDDTSIGGEFEYQWLASGGGNIVSGQNDPNVTIDMEGIYSFRVIDTSNGCTSESSAMVTADNEAPNLDAGPEQELPCGGPLTLTATNDEGITTLDAVWDTMDGTIDGADDELSISVMTEGTYSVTVTNTSNGCTNTDAVTITPSVLPSVMLDGTVPNLNCDQNSVPINILTDENNTINWTTSDGTIDSGVDMTQLIVSSAGTYEGEIIDPNTNCSSTIEVIVMGNTSEPSVNAGDDASYSCIETTATLTATTDTPMGTIEWRDAANNFVGDELTLTVNQAGRYTFNVTNEFGCMRSDDAMVTADTISPIADAGSDMLVGCIGSDITLDGTSSSMGSAFSYAWSTSNGILTAGFNTLTPTVSSAGIYDLIVSNMENGCSNLSSVEISLEGNLEDADGGTDFSTCESTATLSGNIPTDITGMWTTTTNASIDNPSQANISISNLQAGTNTFIWSLSTPDCEDYSRDSVVVTFENAPLAVEDVQTIPVDSTSAGFYVLENDDIRNNDGVTVTFQTDDTNFMDLGDGVFSYMFPNDSLLTFTFSYVVCSDMCPSLCDSTTVTINREEPMIEPVDLDALPNAITPNGDGLNDALVFDIMLLNPQDFPNAELIVFNRWGDVVYKQRPYDNTWQGTNQSGGELPEGTYYFINRLSIENTEVLTGDITIIRD